MHISYLPGAKNFWQHDTKMNLSTIINCRPSRTRSFDDAGSTSVKHTGCNEEKQPYNSAPKVVTNIPQQTCQCVVTAIFLEYMSHYIEQNLISSKNFKEIYNFG
jgi:hypothetical protein